MALVELAAKADRLGDIGTRQRSDRREVEMAGVLTMALFRHHVSAGLPLSAGVTIYVAASDLIPEVNKEPAMKMALLVFVGAGMFFLLESLFHGI